MRPICAAASAMCVALTATAAAAQPARYELATDVLVGARPILRLHAARKLTDLRIDFVRGDGKRFSQRRAVVAEGQTLDLPIGDGAPGDASYRATLSALVTGEGAWRDELNFQTHVRRPLTIGYDADHLDLDGRLLQFRPSRPVAEAELTVIGEDGRELGTGQARYAPDPPATWRAITWSQPDGTRAMVLKLRVTDPDGVVSNVELVPWSVAVDHEDVHFATDSAVIEPSQTARLDQSLAKIAELRGRAERYVKLTLYIAGHTDTVGPSAKNRALSLARAAAIGAYFRKKGLDLPIVVAGYGEDVLRTPTPDNTDEATNRRADYVLGPTGGAPPFSGPYRKARAAWKPLR